MEINEFRKRIVRDTLAYGDVVSEKPPFVPGQTAIPVTTKIWDGMEMAYMVEAVLDGWWTEGRFTDAFEDAMADYVGTRFASFCNSGSSANFLALGACTSPLLGDRRLRPGDPVITTAAAFPTTISPILFWGLKPIFLDVQIGTYLPTLGDIELAIQHHCKDGRGAVMIAHTLGNPWPAHKLMDYEGIFIIEDNCDALGSTVDGATFINKKTGSLGHLATQSFYPAHHITTGEGGMVLTSNGKLKLAVESIRDWGRDCWCDPGKDNTCGKRFDWEFPNLPAGYDHKYVYSHLGMNLKSTDIQAALGLAQMKRLDDFTERRQMNSLSLYLFMKARGLDNFFHMPQASDNSEPSWFGFPLTMRGGKRIALDRSKLIRFLNERRIGTRLLFASNYLQQPLMKHQAFDYGFLTPLPNTLKITRDTFWIGCHPGLTAEMMDYMAESIEEYILDHHED